MEHENSTVFEVLNATVNPCIIKREQMYREGKTGRPERFSFLICLKMYSIHQTETSYKEGRALLEKRWCQHLNQSLMTHPQSHDEANKLYFLFIFFFFSFGALSYNTFLWRNTDGFEWTLRGYVIFTNFAILEEMTGDQTSSSPRVKF